MADNLSDISEAMRKAGEAYAQAIATVGRALQDLTAQAGGGDREHLVDNWLRVARMTKEGMVKAIEQGYDFWEREVRRTAGGSASPQPSNPMDAWAENWRRATEAFNSGNWSEEARKQAESVQKILADGIRTWQRMWEPGKK
jgi:hypothetical protein